MADRDFEKQVQQKMEELQFAPSEAVWQKVDAEINKERKRRPFFWLFFFVGLSVAGTVFYFSINSNNVSVVKNNINVKKELQANKKQENTETITDIKTAETIASTESSKKSIIEKNENDIGKSSSLINTKKKSEIKEEQQPENKNDVAKNYSAIIRKQKNSNDKNFINKNKSAAEKLLIKKEENNNNELINNDDLKNEIIADVIKTNNSTDLEKNKIEKNDSAKNTKTIAVEKFPAKDAAINKPIAKTEKKSKQNSSWKVGATVGAGLSGISNDLFKSALVSTPTATNVNFPTTINSNVPSAIHDGFSFDAGFFIKKFSSPRVSFLAGLNYHYYSTVIKTGSHSDSTSFVYLANLAIARVSNYYNNGKSNTYINHYHFIELPLLINFQLNKNKDLPINWEAGFAVSYLINTNALQFDNTTGIYYKNNNAFNKTQASAATALMIGFPVNGKILEIGPQFQYFFTRLLNKNTGNIEHLFFTGIKISTTFGKK